MWGPVHHHLVTKGSVFSYMSFLAWNEEPVRKRVMIHSEKWHSLCKFALILLGRFSPAHFSLTKCFLMLKTCHQDQLVNEQLTVFQNHSSRVGMKRKVTLSMKCWERGRNRSTFFNYKQFKSSTQQCRYHSELCSWVKEFQVVPVLENSCRWCCALWCQWSLDWSFKELLPSNFTKATLKFKPI